jgi:hypothetical protein
MVADCKQCHKAQEILFALLAASHLEANKSEKVTTSSNTQKWQESLVKRHKPTSFFYSQYPN